jgi:class 3 adenylate cyclase/tetratricopeptide (TPR) repeat protein
MSIDAILKRVDGPRANPLDLLRHYQSDEDARSYWSQDPRLYRAFARKLIGTGHPTRAFEIVREGLGAHPGDQELRYLGALALRRGGNIQRAAEYVDQLLAAPALAPEIRLEAMSLRASLLKERYARSAHPAADIELARESADQYQEAYRLARDESVFPSRDRELFPGINAATMAFLAGAPVRAKELAEAVSDRAKAELERPEGAQDHWLMATAGEAKLLLGDLREAARWYQRAVEACKAGGREGDVEAMRRNFQLLRARIPLSEEIWGFFNVGNVVAFAGHQIDHPARPTRSELPSRFPPDPALIARVEEEIDRHLKALNARVGYCSVACGADILFAERMLERRAELHVILPFDLNDFYRTSVDYGLAVDDEMGGWRIRCDRVLRSATQVHYATTEKYLEDDVLFDFANTFIQGLAILRAGERGVEPFSLVVIDGEHSPPGRVGGTSDYLAKSEERGLESRVIDLAQLREEVGAPPGRPIPAKPAAGPERVRRKTMAMLFADVKNFSKLNDDSYPDFFATFLDEVKKVVDETVPAPVFINTWGDGLYSVFGGVLDGADFALRLVERVGQVTWADLGLPEDTTVRVGIHAGPVYQRMDPIIGRENVFGSQVNRAARIEPVTTPGCVFASEQFAAALAVEANHPFYCEYVGIEDLAKGYDRCPLYLLSRR